MIVPDAQRLMHSRARPVSMTLLGELVAPVFTLRQVFPGGYAEEATPVPIPNTEVKLFRADGTVGATLWESRTLPGF